MRLSAEAPSELGQPEDAPAVHDAGDDAYWISAPKGENGEPIWIDFRFNLNKASDVDTVAGTAFIKLDVVLYWTDPRMIGWPEDHADLPPKLWGPTMELVNALGDMQNESLVFSVVDAKTGRMKRAFGFTGVIENPMNLRDFPFDMDDITIMFATRSHWSTFDGETGGDVAKGMTYRLRQIREEVEGKWLDLSWSGRIGECELHGVSTRVDELSTSAQGQDQTDVVLSFHVTRKSAFYFWKCLLPLYLLFTLSLSTFHLETDNLEARVSTVSTYCLASLRDALRRWGGPAEDRLPHKDRRRDCPHDSVASLNWVGLAGAGKDSQGLGS